MTTTSEPKPSDAAIRAMLAAGPKRGHTRKSDYLLEFACDEAANLLPVGLAFFCTGTCPVRYWVCSRYDWDTGVPSIDGKIGRMSSDQITRIMDRLSATPGIESLHDHYKGTRYQVVATGIHVDTFKVMVAYKCVDDPGEGQPLVWARTLFDWNGVVERPDGTLVRRFTEVADVLDVSFEEPKPVEVPKEGRSDRERYVLPKAGHPVEPAAYFEVIKDSEWTAGSVGRLVRANPEDLAILLELEGSCPTRWWFPSNRVRRIDDAVVQGWNGVIPSMMPSPDLESKPADPTAATVLFGLLAGRWFGLARMIKRHDCGDWGRLVLGDEVLVIREVERHYGVRFFWVDSPKIERPVLVPFDALEFLQDLAIGQSVSEPSVSKPIPLLPKAGEKYLSLDQVVTVVGVAKFVDVGLVVLFEPRPKGSKANQTHGVVSLTAWHSSVDNGQGFAKRRFQPIG